MINFENLLTNENATKVITILSIIAVTWFFNYLSQRTINKIGKQKKLAPGIIIVADKVLRMAIASVGIITVLDTFGVSVSAIVTSLGISGLALSFALKDTLSNLISGFLILLYRPFKIGDTIATKGFSSSKDFVGKVVQIDLRYTTLQNETETVLIPNNTIATNPVVIKK